MDSVSARDFLYADPRPTCVFDLNTRADQPGASKLSAPFTNPALQSQSRLLRDVLEGSDHNAGAYFRLRTWVFDINSAAPSTILEDGALLRSGPVLGYTIDDRWRVLQWQGANPQLHHSAVPINGGPSEKTAPSLPPLGQHHDNRSEEFREVLGDRDHAAARLALMHATMEIVDVGFFEYNTNGELLYANEAFYKLSGHPKMGTSGYTWLDCVYEEDKEDLMQRWITLGKGKPSTFEMRWKGPPGALSAPEDSAPENDAGGCITDIAAQKRSVSDALKRAEALERAQISERRFTRLANNANVGIFIVDLEMKIVYCNSEWFAISGHPVVDFADVSWAEHLLAEDLATVDKYWNQMIETKQAVNFQLRWQKPWLDAQGTRGTPHTWTMCCIYHEPNSDGSITSVAGFLTDISHLIWAESAQKQRTDEAIEAKRQQENFIDMTCHEIRNPLGAVMHCADLIESTASEIAELLKDTLPSLPNDNRSRYESLSKSSAEAVDTIVSCSTHQKRIMDDILTLSKLDSKLLTIVPSLSQVDDVLKIAEKMFEVDARKVGITLQVWREQIDGEPQVNWVMLDRGRLMQVLINLLTNALKFTQKEAKKVVTVSMRVSQAKLSEQDLGVELVPVSTVRDRHLTRSHTGEEVYLYFKVVDSGCGFDHEQKLAIFERFAQASPRTHSTYGGSGLGLHITRELIEMQGGEIGVSSQ
nr:hypothetical protein B0A51_05645 [Rachicladosporium sp. CCFEE 5018]